MQTKKLELTVSQIQDAMNRLAYFQAWPRDAVANLAATAQMVCLPKNDLLSHKGELLDKLYVVVTGMLRLFIPLPNNLERVVGLSGPSDSVGESCLVVNDPCPYNVVAGKDSHLLAINGLSFRRELAAHPELTTQTLHLIARRLTEVLRDTEICAQPSSVQRVASYLMLYRSGRDTNSFSINLPARKQDIAAKLGLSQETFSRVLGFLDKQGLVRVEGSDIHVVDAQQLTQVSSMRATPTVDP